jgi:hypothetical protein
MWIKLEFSFQLSNFVLLCNEILLYDKRRRMALANGCAARWKEMRRCHETILFVLDGKILPEVVLQRIIIESRG